MKRGLVFFFSLLLMCGFRLAEAREVQSSVTLENLGVLRPDRLSGTAVQKDYYLPLPSRVFNATASHVRVEIQASPLLDPRSVVGIWINDRPVDTKRIGAAGAAPLVLEGAIPKGTRADDPSRNILKLTIKGRLRLAAAAPDAELESAAAWIDVEPESSFACAFDDASADWLSLGRLAMTLRPQVEIVLPENPAPSQIELALNLASWVAKCAPRSELHFSEGAPDATLTATDHMVIEPETQGAPQIEATAEGLERTIHLRAPSDGDARAIMDTLNALAAEPLPGSSVKLAARVEPTKATTHEGGAFLRDLDAASMAVSRGTGDTACTIHFDLAKVTHGPADLELDFGATISPVRGGAEPTLDVFLNDRLVYSDTLPAGATHFARQIRLPASELKGNNEVTVSVAPTAGSTDAYFWQLDPDSAMRVVAAAKAPAPLGLLDAARFFADGSAYQVWLATPSDWPVAALSAAWLQRVNPIAQLRPKLVSSLSDNEPALIVGSLGSKPPVALADVPVTADEKGLRIVSSKDSTVLPLAPAGGVGIWQLGSLRNGIPAILVDGWGEGDKGRAAMESVSAQMAGSVWIESGDVVLGDGVTPPLTFATREASVPNSADVPAPMVARPPAAHDAVVNSTSPVAEAAIAGADWKQFRWWIVGGLWLALSAVIIWIFEQSRRRVSS
jgi:hypothetical protein